MENMVIEGLFGGVYKDRVCLVTGHTGFKGSWLAHWLSKMGAKVIGYSLDPNTEPNHFELLGENYVSVIGDIRNQEALRNVLVKYKPEIVFHLAAQAIVRHSYTHPVETYETNIMGTLNIFEAVRSTKSVKVIINVTSDKCYENKEWIWGYREDDAFGGHDPYSSSKACSEILTASYRNSFFRDGNTLLASGRAGNVIGGGDWAEDRLIPDIVKSVNKESKVFIRNPLATRPWQHVLEPLSGYLMLAWKLFEKKSSYADGWNFGPTMESNIMVKEVVKIAKDFWPEIEYDINTEIKELHEANLLMLDCSKAYKILKWQSVWGLKKTFSRTMAWYRQFYQKNQINTDMDIYDYISDAKSGDLEWTR